MTSNTLLWLLVGAGLATVVLLSVRATRMPAQIENAETWEMERNGEGRIQRITVHRQVAARATAS